MINKEEIKEMLQDAGQTIKAGVKEEAAFTFKAAVIGVSIAYSIKSASVAYSKIKSFLGEAL